MLADLLNAEPSTSTPNAGPSRSRHAVQGNGGAQDPASDDEVVALDQAPKSFSRSPSNARNLDIRANGTPQRSNPMSIHNLNSPDPTSRPGTSRPSPLPSPAVPSSSRATDNTLQPHRPSQQDSEDVTMEEGNDGDGDEDEDIGDTTAMLEDGEDGAGDEDDEENDDDSDEGSSGESSDSGDDDEDIEITGSNTGPGGDSLLPGAVKAEPGEPGAAGATDLAAEGEVNTLVPKKKKSRKREASTDEGMPPPPPPIPTIRLEYKLNPEGEDSEFNVLEAAQALGLIPNWASNEEPEPDAVEAAEPVDAGSALLPGMDSLSPEEIARRIDEQHAAQERAKASSKKKKVVKRVKDVYDVEDDFIDDSDMAIDDAQTHIPRPTKEGFFVHAGPLEIMSAPTNKSGPKRPPAKKARIAEDETMPSLAATTARKIKARNLASGTVTDPLAIDDDDEPALNAEAGPSSPMNPIKRDTPPLGDDEFPQSLMKVEHTKYYGASRDPRWLPPFLPFPPDVQRALLRLRLASENHQWAGKKSNGKASFPPQLKPPLLETAKVIFQHELLSEREEDLRNGIFTSLPACLPFNTTTLRKLFYRTCQEAYWHFLEECEDTGLERLSYYVKQEQDKWISKYNESVEQWKQRPQGGDDQPAEPTLPLAIDNEDDPASAAAVASQKGSNPEPKKLSIWSPEMKEAFGQLIDNHDDMVDLNRTLLKLDIQNNHSDREHTEQNMKSRLYKRAADVFPEGYTSSTQLSRYSSAMRKKDKKQ